MSGGGLHISDIAYIDLSEKVVNKLRQTITAGDPTRHPDDGRRKIAATSDDLLASTTAAIAPLGRVPAAARPAGYRHAALATLKDDRERSFPAADRGLRFSSRARRHLARWQRPPPSHPSGWGRHAHGRRRHSPPRLCPDHNSRALSLPLDLADTLPAIRFGNASILIYSAEELAGPIDRKRLARTFAEPTSPSRQPMFDMRCQENGIEHRLTKVKHSWTNGSVEQMNRTLKDATVKRSHYDAHDQLRQHLNAVADAYNFGRGSKMLRGFTHDAAFCKA